MLGISKNTVPETLKTVEPMLWYVNANYFENHDNNDDIDIELVLIDEAETDEIWSYVHDKSQQCRLWWAIDHNTGEPLAFHFGTREQKNLDELLKLLKPFKINVVCSDDNFAYKKRIIDSEVITGKINTQKTERKRLSLRTWCGRLVRKGIRFSKNMRMHKIVIALKINFWFFGGIV